MLLAPLRPISVRKKTFDQAALISCKLPGQGVYQFSREAVGSGKKHEEIQSKGCFQTKRFIDMWAD